MKAGLAAHRSEALAERQEMLALDEDETAHLLDLLGESRLYMPTILAVTTGRRAGLGRCTTGCFSVLA